MDIRNANGETDDILGYLVYVVEDIGHCIFSNSRHSVRLATACLPVGKNSRWKKRVSGEEFFQLVWRWNFRQKERKTKRMKWIPTIYAADNWQGNFFGSFLVHLLRGTVAPKHSVCSRNISVSKMIKGEENRTNYTKMKAWVNAYQTYKQPETMTVRLCGSCIWLCYCLCIPNPKHHSLQFLCRSMAAIWPKQISSRRGHCWIVHPTAIARPRCLIPFLPPSLCSANSNTLEKSR